MEVEKMELEYEKPVPLSAQGFYYEVPRDESPIAHHGQDAGHFYEVPVDESDRDSVTVQSGQFYQAQVIAGDTHV
jgi:hypothetical protein